MQQRKYIIISDNDQERANKELIPLLIDGYSALDSTTTANCVHYLLISNPDRPENTDTLKYLIINDGDEDKANKELIPYVEENFQPIWRNATDNAIHYLLVKGAEEEKPEVPQGGTLRSVEELFSDDSTDKPKNAKKGKK